MWSWYNMVSYYLTDGAANKVIKTTIVEIILAMGQTEQQFNTSISSK